jgi:hypothetical protein
MMVNDIKCSLIRNAALTSIAVVAAAFACGAGEVNVEKVENGIWRVRMERAPDCVCARAERLRTLARHRAIP